MPTLYHIQLCTTVHCRGIANSFLIWRRTSKYDIEKFDEPSREKIKSLRKVELCSITSNLLQIDPAEF